MPMNFRLFLLSVLLTASFALPAGEIVDYSVTAGSNNAASPNGMSEGAAPSTLNDSWREGIARLKRWYVDTNCTTSSAGSANAYTLAAAATVTAYAQGQVYCFKSNFANTGAATLNVDSVGAKAIKKLQDQDLVSGDIESGQIVMVAYNSTDDTFEMISSTAQFAGTFIGSVDMNGAELILDADADTSITADTDDQIDIRISGADDFRLTANLFDILSGSELDLNSGSTLDVNGAVDFDATSGDISNVTLGATTPAAGTFTSLTATGAFTSLGIDDNASAVALTLDSSGYALFGHTSSVAQGSATSNVQISSDTNDSRALGLFKYTTTDSQAASLIISKSGNATKGSHTIVASGEDLGAVGFQGSNGTTFDFAARIVAKSGGTPGASNDMPGMLVFETVPDGSVTLTEAMRIDSNQDVGIGTAATPSARLHVSDSVSSDVLMVESTEAGATAANFTLYRNSASPAASDGTFQILFDGEDAAGNQTTYGSIRTIITDTTNGSEDGRLQLGSIQAGTVNADAWTLDLGLYADNASGGDKGVGTINADAVYDDNTLLTDYVLDYYMDGEVNPDNYTHDKWRSFDVRTFDVDVYAAIWMRRHALPCFKSRMEGAGDNTQSTGELIQCLMENAEVNAVHVKQLSDENHELRARMDSLEARLAALESAQ